MLSEIYTKYVVQSIYVYKVYIQKVQSFCHQVFVSNFGCRRLLVVFRTSKFCSVFGMQPCPENLLGSFEKLTAQLLMSVTVDTATTAASRETNSDIIKVDSENFQFQLAATIPYFCSSWNQFGYQTVDLLSDLYGFPNYGIC